MLALTNWSLILSFSLYPLSIIFLELDFKVYINLFSWVFLLATSTRSEDAFLTAGSCSKCSRNTQFIINRIIEKNQDNFRVFLECAYPPLPNTVNWCNLLRIQSYTYVISCKKSWIMDTMLGTWLWNLGCLFQVQFWFGHNTPAALGP